tara:strand:- start:350 stop:2620 length:2271 start_codon:yes stop_codon:yes gene_type:complete
MELYINSILVDLNEKIPFPLTFAISDIKDISARKGNNSKTIALPGTATNVQLMANVFSLSATAGAPITFMNFDPSVKASARYYHNGVLEFNGVCQLQDCNQQDGNWTFNIVLISETIDYIGRMKNIKINALDWSEYNHPFTADSQYDSWNGTIVRNGAPFTNGSGADWYGLGYYYGLVDYGYQRPAPATFAVEHIPPHVFVYDILKKSFESAEITWQSTFFESQRFKRLLMAYPGGVLPQITPEQAALDSAFTSENNDASGFVMQATSVTGNFWINPFTSFNIYDSTIVADPSGQIQSASPMSFVPSSEGLFAVRYEGDHEITISTNAGVLVWGNYRVSLVVRKNGIIDSTTTLTEGAITPGVASMTMNYSFAVLPSINMTFSDVLDARLQLDVWDGQIAGFGNINVTIESLGATLDVEKQPQSLTPGSTLNIATLLPDMSADVFFKGLINMFNLYVKPNETDPTIMEIEPLVDFYEGTDTALDWTLKLDKSQNVKITPTINFASKDYRFSFEKDDDYWSKRYADDVLVEYGNNSVSSGTAFSQNVTEVKLPFSQKPLVRIPDGTGFTQLIVPCSYQMKTESNGVSQIVEKVAKPFIVQLIKGDVGTLEEGDWVHVDEFDDPIARTKYPYVGHLDSLLDPSFDLMWGVPQYVFYSTGEVTLYTTDNLYGYHERFIREIISKFGKQLTAKIMLESKDIGELDFKKLIQIDGVMFRLQKVSNYDSGKYNSTESEFIRLTEAESAQTYTVTISPDKYQR